MRRWFAALRGRLRPVPLPTAASSAVEFFGPEEIDDITRFYRENGNAEGGPWDRYRHAHMVLPDWFEQGLDPWSAKYAEQQHRLWRLVAGVDRDYDPHVDEREFGWDGTDPVRFPGYYKHRDPNAVARAADHVLATGMLLQQSGVRPGDWALEYGAGFAQTALTFARLGVNVDTVDISETFCGFVRAQAEFFQVPLHAHHGAFGARPVPDRRYRLIWFYESFHHCVDFMTLVSLLDAMLDDGGRIVLAGEPIVEKSYEAVPYPWGVRLNSEVAAVMRQTRWFELGFTEAFLYELFARSGFSGRRIECGPSLFGRLYVFERRQPT